MELVYDILLFLVLPINHKQHNQSLRFEINKRNWCSTSASFPRLSSGFIINYNHSGFDIKNLIYLRRLGIAEFDRFQIIIRVPLSKLITFFKNRVVLETLRICEMDRNHACINCTQGFLRLSDHHPTDHFSAFLTFAPRISAHIRENG